VITVTTADRIDFRPWTSATRTVAVPEDTYVGRHRRPGARGFALLRLLYRSRHRRH
jgi:hypothetical protein